MKKQKSKKKAPLRSGTAVAAMMRHGGPMKHRLEPKKGAKNEQAEILKEVLEKDVHTEHCCVKHGCKYGEKDCLVERGIRKQSFPCEQCECTCHDDTVIPFARGCPVHDIEEEWEVDL